MTTYQLILSRCNPWIHFHKLETTTDMLNEAADSVNTFFSIYLILSAALGPGVHSACNRNEYQKQKNHVCGGVQRDRCVRLSVLPLSVSRMSRQCWIINTSQHYRTSRPVTGIALLYGDGTCFLWGTNWTVSTATSSQYLAVNCEPTVRKSATKTCKKRAYLLRH
jgi:hypothetical protein